MYYKITIIEISSQDGGIGKHASPLRTTIAKKYNVYKTNITQNCQKIKLYGSPTTKDLKKPHSSRRVGEVETRGGGEAQGDVET